jgi:hypothetical protein
MQEPEFQAIKSTAAAVTERGKNFPGKISSQIPAQPLPRNGLPSRADGHARFKPLVAPDPSPPAPPRKQPHPRTIERRGIELPAAAKHAALIGSPLNTLITASWRPLAETDGCVNKTWQRKGPRDRDAYFRDEIRRWCKRAGVTFRAIWSRAIGSKKVGPHIHIFINCPPALIADLVAFIEKLTGADAKFGHVSKSAKTVARSWGGGWQIDRNVEGPDGERRITNYICRQHVHHTAPQTIDGKDFGSTAAIGPKARKKFLAAYGACNGR